MARISHEATEVLEVQRPLGLLGSLRSSSGLAIGISRVTVKSQSRPLNITLVASPFVCWVH